MYVLFCVWNESKERAVRRDSLCFLQDIQHEGSHLLPAGAESVDHISRSLSMMGGLLDDIPVPGPKCAHTTLQHNNIYHNAG